MDPQKYKIFVENSAFYPKISKSRDLSYLFLGLVEEVGEILEILDENDSFNDIIKECGDVLWYATAMSNVIEYDLYQGVDVEANVAKDCISDDKSSVELFTSLSKIAGPIKKSIRDNHGNMTDTRLDQIKSALDEILQSIINILHKLNISILEALRVNYEKITSRQTRGVMRGDGNDR